MTPAILAPTTAPAKSSGPQPYRFTIEDYRKLGPTGLFQGKKTLLIDGVIPPCPCPDQPTTPP